MSVCTRITSQTWSLLLVLSEVPVLCSPLHTVRVLGALVRLWNVISAFLACKHNILSLEDMVSEVDLAWKHSSRHEEIQVNQLILY